MGAFDNRFAKAGQGFILLGLFAVLPATRAEILFKDTFDAEPYSDNEALVVGPNQIANGVWSLNNRGQGAVVISTESSLSPRRSLALVCPENDDQAQAVARFTVDGKESSTAQALTAKFAFRLPEPGTEVIVVVRSVEEVNLVTLTIRSGGPIKMLFGERVADLGRVEADEWYELVLSLPANPGAAESEYTATLLDAKDHSEIDVATGPLGNSGSPTEYRYLSVYSRNTQASPTTAYFDDFSIECAK